MKAKFNTQIAVNNAIELLNAANPTMIVKMNHPNRKYPIACSNCKGASA